MRLEGRGEWLTEQVWRVHERFALGSGFGFERRMFMEQVAPGRVHATADDMPLGAEIELFEDGFRFRRFRSWLAYRGVRFRLGCTSETRVAATARCTPDPPRPLAHPRRHPAPHHPHRARGRSLRS